MNARTRSHRFTLIAWSIVAALFTALVIGTAIVFAVFYGIH